MDKECKKVSPGFYPLKPLIGKKDHALTHRINPEYSFGARVVEFLNCIDDDNGPGTKYALEKGVKAYNHDLPIPSYSFGIALENSRIFEGDGPGPNNYSPVDPDLIKYRAPAYSIQSRKYSCDKLGQKLTYCLPPMLGPKVIERNAAPEITLKASFPPISETQENSPGPIYYPCNPYRKCNPGWTMTGRGKDMNGNDWICSPASYFGDKDKTCCQVSNVKCTFGGRWKENTGIVRTKCDIY